MFIEYQKTIYNLNKYGAYSRFKSSIILYDKGEIVDKLLFSDEEECINAFSGIQALTKPLVLKVTK